MRLLLSLLLLASGQLPAKLNLALPTENTAIFDGNGEDFYMYTTRFFEGKSSKPWTGGKYGFTRNLRRLAEGGVIATRFHEGLDIKPIRRDRSGNPLDEIRAIAKGTVVYLNKARGGSNYGRYLVVEHDFPSGRYYSLYAHLSSITTTLGKQVARGEELGIMGFTGRGINRERAHLHLELGLLLSSHFDAWHGHFFGGPSPHGIHNGMNLTGIDIASLFLTERENPTLTIPKFLSAASPYFKVAIPRDGPLEIVHRYPWLAKGNHQDRSLAWEISFTDSGIPLAVRPSNRRVTHPTVVFVRSTISDHKFYTRSRLTGQGRRASLTKSGQRYLALFTNQFSTPPIGPPQPSE